MRFEGVDSDSLLKTATSRLKIKGKVEVQAVAELVLRRIRSELAGSLQAVDDTCKCTQVFIIVISILVLG